MLSVRDSYVKLAWFSR